MSHVSVPDPNFPHLVLDLAKESFENFFLDNPVMLHVIDRDGTLIKVNRQWLNTLGYEASEVLGRKSVEFLTDVAQIRVLRDTMPLFWRVGTAKSIGLQFVCKNGQLLDVLLDAEVVNTAGGRSALAALYYPDSLTQWNKAAKAIQMLQQLVKMRYQLEDILASVDNGNSHTKPASTSREESGQPVPTGELVGPLLEAVQDITHYLRALARLIEQWLETEEHQLELLTVAKSIEKTLGELA